VSPSDEAGVLELRDIPALVWEALDGELSLDQLVEDLAAVFDQSDEAIRADVGELVAAMVEAGLVEAV